MNNDDIINIIKSKAKEAIALMLCSAEQLYNVGIIPKGDIFTPNTYEWFNFKLPLVLFIDDVEEQVNCIEKWDSLFEEIVKEVK